MASFVRISVLIWADILAGYALWVVITYLTNVWNIGFTRAAAIVNFFTGAASIMPIGMAFLVDTFMGDFYMLLLSSLAFSIGLSFLAMSMPPVLSEAAGNCSAYQPNCIGDTQKVLFYIGLALTAVGLAGHATSLQSFLEFQKRDQTQNDQTDPPRETETETGGKQLWQIVGAFFMVLFTVVGGIALPYIKPWSARFGIPAICTVIATLLFLSGSCTYRRPRPQGSPLTTLFRVFAASASKILHRLPRDPNDLYEIEKCDRCFHTRGLRCLDKAAIILPTPNREQQERNRWKLCRVTEVEETKITIRMIPMWMTFIMCGVVSSIGNTYSLEQANHMDRKVGHLKVPLQLFLIFHDIAKAQFTFLYVKIAKCLTGKQPGKCASVIGFVVAMIFSILCCITAAKVEKRRLSVVKGHGLLDKPDDIIPMTIFWLLPQFLLLGALDGIFEYSMDCFFNNQVPRSMGGYLKNFSNGVKGAGFMGSVLTVYLAGKASERGGKRNWFQDTLNKSRLDNYYWTLSVLSSVNLGLFILVAIWYPYKKPGSTDTEVPDYEQTAPYDQQGCCVACFGQF